MRIRIGNLLEDSLNEKKHTDVFHEWKMFIYFFQWNFDCIVSNLQWWQSIFFHRNDINIYYYYYCCCLLRIDDVHNCAK